MSSTQSRAPRGERIVKQRQALLPAQNLVDHAANCSTFRWDDAARGLDGLPAGVLNIAYEAVDRHFGQGRGSRTAIRQLGNGGQQRELSYADQAAATNRFANALGGLGVQLGERVFVLMGRLPEVYVVVLGALKACCVVSPLFPAFGSQPIATRSETGDGRVLVTTHELHRRKLQGFSQLLPGLKHVLMVGEAAAPDTLRWADVVDTASADCSIGATDPESMGLLHFTSGTTRRPNGATQMHAAVLAHLVTGRYALDLHDGDVFWCTAEPGWVTGTSYDIIAPLANGVNNVMVEAEFDAPTW